MTYLNRFAEVSIEVPKKKEYLAGVQLFFLLHDRYCSDLSYTIHIHMQLSVRTLRLLF